MSENESVIAEPLTIGKVLGNIVGGIFAVIYMIGIAFLAIGALIVPAFGLFALAWGGWTVIKTMYGFN